MNAQIDIQTRRLIALYQAFQLFFSLLLWLPIFYEYQKHFGLNDAEIFRIQSIYYLFFCFIEIPTGLFADRFGTRTSLRYGAAVLIISNVLAATWATYSGFLAHFLLIAVARSLISGAVSSYLYEHLRTHGAVTEYKKYEGRARAYGLFAKVACWGAVGWLMRIDVTIPYWLTAISAAIAFAISMMLPNGVEIAGAGSLDYLGRFARVFRVLRTQPRLFLVMLQGVGVFVLARICQVNLFQPLLNSGDVPKSWHGGVMGAMVLFEAAGSLRPDLTSRFKDDRLRMVWFTVLIGAALIFTAYSSQMLMIAALCVFSFGVGLASPIQQQQMNDVIPDSSVRATLLSVESILDRAICAVVAAALGPVVASGSVKSFLIAASLVAFVLVLIGALNSKAPLRDSQGALHNR